MFPTLPDPLHPAVVHVPMALAALLPLITLGGALAVRFGWLQPRSWAYVVALQGVLAISCLVAHETGEHEEERVEKVVDERFVKEHDERADVFQWIAYGAVAVSAAGLLSGAAGGAARAATVALSLALLVAGIRVGHAGGELVYVHGAGNAYTSPSGKAPAAGAAEPRGGGETGAVRGDADD